MSGIEKKKLTASILQQEQNSPFDQYQRYRIVADVVEWLREGPGSLRVLDIGGEDILPNFLSEDRVTVLGRRDAEGDAATLPFEDEAFDYATSVDVYDRIESAARDKHLSELRRVSQKGVLLVAPFDSHIVRGAERVANEFHRTVHLAENLRLQKHAENGLPKLDDVRRFFEEHEDTVFVLPNGYIPHWLTMTCLASYGSKLEDELGGIFDRVNAFYNEYVYGLDNTEPCYRHLLVSLKEPTDADLGQLAPCDSDPERASRSTALFGVLYAVLPLVTEVKQLNVRLAQFERQLVQKEGALARKEAQVNDLSHRLAEQVSVRNNSLLQQDRNKLKQQQDWKKLKRQKDELQRQLEVITSSRAWRLLTVLHKLSVKLRLRKSGSG